MKIYDGKYLKLAVHENKYFDNLIKFILEHFDNADMTNAVMVVEDFYYHPVDYYRQHFPGKKIIFYNWEHMVGNNTYLNINNLIKNSRGVDELWDFDHLNAEFWRGHGIDVDRVEPFRYTESIKTVVNRENPEIDVLLFGYMTDVRMEKLKKIYPALYHNFTVVTITGMDRDKQDRYVGNSKIILNLHGMEPYCRQEQERISYCLINEKCVLSEPSQLNYFPTEIIELPVDQMAGKIIELVQTDNWKYFADQAARTYKAKRFEIKN